MWERLQSFAKQSKATHDSNSTTDTPSTSKPRLEGTWSRIGSTRADSHEKEHTSAAACEHKSIGDKASRGEATGFESAAESHRSPGPTPRSHRSATAPNQQQQRRQQQRPAPANKGGRLETSNNRTEPSSAPRGPSDDAQEPAVSSLRERPLGFGQTVAPACSSTELSDSRAETGSESVCLVCRERATFWAIGSCAHRICLLCAHRIRCLYRLRRCVVCNQDLEEMLVIPAGEMQSSPELKQDATTDSNPDIAQDMWDATAAMKYSNRTAWEQMRALQIPTCPACGFQSASPSGLRRHVQKTHPSYALCEVCAGSGRKYWAELRLYPVRTKAAHSRAARSSPEERMSGGSRDGTLRDHLRSEHAECRFCKRFYYDDDALYEHLTQSHETCALCERDGIQYVYYRNFEALEEHYRSAHYVCDAPSCRGLAFATLLDLQAHQRRACPGAHQSTASSATALGRTFRFQELQQQQQQQQQQRSGQSSWNVNETSSARQYDGIIHRRDEPTITAARRRGFSGSAVVYASATESTTEQVALRRTPETSESRNRQRQTVDQRPRTDHDTLPCDSMAHAADARYRPYETNASNSDPRFATSNPGIGTNHRQRQALDTEVAHSSRDVQSQRAGDAEFRTAADHAMHPIPKTEEEAMRRGARLLERVKALLRAESPGGQESWLAFCAHCERLVRGELQAGACVQALERLLMESGASRSVAAAILFEMCALQPDPRLREALFAACRALAAHPRVQSNEAPPAGNLPATRTLSSVVRNTNAHQLSSNARARAQIPPGPDAFPCLRRTSTPAAAADASTHASATERRGRLSASARIDTSAPGEGAHNLSNSISDTENALAMMRVGGVESPGTPQQSCNAGRSAVSSSAQATRFDGGTLFEPGRGGKVLHVAQLAREHQAQRLERGVWIGRRGFAWEHERDAQRRLAAKTQLKDIAATRSPESSAS